MSGAGDKGAAQVGLGDLERLDFAKGDGLLPAIVQHAVTGAVLMLGYMNRQALAEGPKRLAQKVGEEGLEVALAAASGSDAEMVAEAADLLYHLLVLLRFRGLPLERVIAELRARHAAKP